MPEAYLTAHFAANADGNTDRYSDLSLQLANFAGAHTDVGIATDGTVDDWLTAWSGDKTTMDNFLINVSCKPGGTWNGAADAAAAAEALTAYDAQVEADAKAAVNYDDKSTADKSVYDEARQLIVDGRNTRDADEKVAAGYAGMPTHQQALFDTSLLASKVDKTAACAESSTALACVKADEIRAAEEATRNTDGYYAKDIAGRAADDSLRKIQSQLLLVTLGEDAAAAGETGAGSTGDGEGAAEAGTGAGAESGNGNSEATGEAADCEDSGTGTAREKLTPLEASVATAKTAYDDAQSEYALAGVESSQAIEAKLAAATAHQAAVD